MAGAGTGRERIKGSVFQKLEGQAGIKEGERNLQYPTELGDDEYNHFVLFTVYDKDSEEVQSEQRKVTLTEEDAYIDRLKTIEEEGLVDGIAEGGVNFLVGLGEALGLVEESPESLRVSDAEKILEQKQKEAQSSKQSAIEQFINQQSKDSVKYYGEGGVGLDITYRANSPVLGRVRLSPATYKQSTNIALYIPQKLVNNGSISYNNVSFDISQGIKSLGAGDLSGIGPSVRRYLSKTLDSVTNLVGINTNANETIQAVTGLAVNPRAEQIFNGVSTRSFDMTFRLVPRNQSEAVEVSNIIRAFRKYSHPSVRTGSFFLAVPSEFEIRYYRTTAEGTALENLFLNKIGRCALTAVNVDYSPSSISSFFYDGSPVSTALTLTFTEFRPLTREDIEEGY